MWAEQIESAYLGLYHFFKKAQDHEFERKQQVGGWIHGKGRS